MLWPLLNRKKLKFRKMKGIALARTHPFGLVNPKVSVFNYAQQGPWCLSKELADAWRLCNFHFWLPWKYLRGIWCYSMLSCIWMNSWIEKSVVKWMFKDLPGGPMAKICLPMQGNLSWILGQGTKIPTCQGANKPTYPNQRSLQAATKSPHAAKKIQPSQKKKSVCDKITISVYGDL